MLTLNGRQEQIYEALTRQGRLSVAALARQLRVAPMTIRRDLARMEAAGLLMRTHGGCVLASPFVAELSFPEKLRRRQREKTAIARAAVQLMREGETVYLDTGTTALAVARALPADRNLRVVTGNLRVAMELFGRAGVQVMVLGGRLGTRNPDLIGPEAVAQLEALRFDTAVLGADAIDASRGEVHSADADSAALSRAAAKRADKVLVVADSSKLGRRGMAMTVRLAEGVCLVTDDGVDKRMREALRATGAKVVFARVEEGRDKQGNVREE